MDYAVSVVTCYTSQQVRLFAVTDPELEVSNSFDIQHVCSDDFWTKTLKCYWLSKYRRK